MKHVAWVSLMVLGVVWIVSPPVYGQSFHNALSFQGYTGLLNTPNAMVTDQGQMDTVFSNQEDYNRRDVLDGAENYMFSIGLLPYVEVGARLTEEQPYRQYADINLGIRDISANAKFQIPRFFDNDWIPDMAIGFQDIGGGSSFFRTHYVVMSKTIDPIRLSLGYGIGPDRLEGVFGGAEIRVFDWLYLLGEYDTDESNLGLRLLTPNNLLPFNLGLTAKTCLDYEPGNFDIAMMIQVPLGSDHHEVKADITSPMPSRFSGTDRRPSESSSDAKTDPDAKLAALKQRLMDLGFENIRVGVKNDTTLYIEYENNRYNHNEMDGLGLVMGTGVEMAPESMEKLEVVIRENDIAMMTVTTGVASARSFFAQDSEDPLGVEFDRNLTLSMDVASTETVRFVGERANWSLFRTRLYLYPGLITFLATDVDAFDALLSIRPEARMSLWKGAVINARWDIPLIWTENFDDRKPWRKYRDDARLDNLMLHQTFRIVPGLMTMFSAGMYLKDNNGILNETMWYSPSGTHRIKLKAGFIREDREREDFDREIYLASYRYFFDPLDLSLEGTYGQYWNQDKGWLVKMQRFFGDTAVSLFYRHIGTDEGERAIGINFSFPLTPRRDMKPHFVQVMGTDRWTYEQQTTVADKGKSNQIATGLAIVPNTSHSLDRSYFNHDRLHEAYMRNHLARLREAYLKWKDVD